jgi:hypothetical protein
VSPHHQGFVRELRTGTALLLSASWLVSENARRVREMAGEYVRVAEDPSLRRDISGAILLSGVKANLKEMH